MARRVRFSLATMMLVTAACAGALTVWLLLIYEPPTHKIPAYERAPGTRGNSIQVGPNRVSLRILARNDRDRSIHYDAEQSASAKLTPAEEGVLASSAAWLDVVQIELDPGPELLDIIEIRIFDHEKRERLPEIDRAYGWRAIAPNAVQLYGLGKRLPATLDIWFRAHSYAAGDPVGKLKPAAGETCKLPGFEAVLRDIRAGSWSYRSGHGLVALQDNRDVEVTIVLSWTAEAEADDYQIIAVTKSGKRINSDLTPHYLSFRSGVPSEAVMNFHVPLTELDHFELRPFGGRECFFFEAVALPQTSQQPFAQPPSAKLTIAGKETEAQLQEFAPLDVRIATHRGRWATGTSASGLWADVTPADSVVDEDAAFTITYYREGVSAPPLHFRFIDGQSKTIPEADLQRRAQGAAASATTSAGYMDYQTPLERIEAIEIRLAP